MAPDPESSSAQAKDDSQRRRYGNSPILHNPKTVERFYTKDMLSCSTMFDRPTTLSLLQKNAEQEYWKDFRIQKQQFFAQAAYGQGYNGYGNGHTDGKFALVYPQTKPRAGKKKTRPLRVSRKDMAKQAEAIEMLVPIRLDVDYDKIKLRDTFTWNLHDRTVSPDLFAEQLIEDLGLQGPHVEPVLSAVKDQLKEQLGDFMPPVYTEEDALDPELPYLAYKNDEMRILIKLNITIGPHTLVDQFEWELNNPLNSAEEFAQLVARELSLAGEFTTAIAHCIHEQCQLFTRSLYIVDHAFDGRPIEDADLVAGFLPSPIPSVFRPQQLARDYAPYLYELNEAELERNELMFSREQRRQKRSVTRRGGPTLPDLKERLRTVRTLVVSSVLPGAAETIEDSRIFKRVGNASGRGKRGFGASGGQGDSDESESEDSSPDSPAMSNLNVGTARTRGMRGAATAAQQRMANLGRSETPEALTLHHHETRTSARRFPGRDVREESVDNPQLIIKLKIGKERLRNFMRERKAGSRPQALQQIPAYSAHTRSQSAGFGTSGAMGPPSTSGTQNQQLNTKTSNQQSNSSQNMALPHGHIGRVEAAPPPAPGQPLPPPVRNSSSVSDVSDDFDEFGSEDFDGSGDSDYSDSSL